MGGEGAMMTANISLKNNRNLLLKRKEKRIGSYTNVTLKELPKATPEQLIEIKENIQKENKKARTKTFLVFGVLIFIVLLLLI